jgi:hypothetical protein
MSKFIFTTTGTESLVRFEELGAYFEHPTSAYTLSDYFDLDEITNSPTIQQYLDNGHIIAYDEFGNSITSLEFIKEQSIPIFDVDNSFYNISYIGYGNFNTCKIQKIQTTITGYTASWASGNEVFDKIWSNRYNYTYF